ncbi:MAG TPA: phosphatase PAP2 family protein [Anaeromyxobacteraceae bacterium]
MSIEALYQLDPTLSLQRLMCHPWLDLPMAVLSTAGEGWFLALVAAGLAWKANPDRPDALRSALRFLVVLAVTGVLVAVTKRMVDAPRPLLVLGGARVRVLLDPLHRMSFPSGHAAAAAALALLAWREPPAGSRRWPWAFAFLCGLSRVYVGAHWVTDVVAGWLLGVAVAAVACRAWPLPRRASARPAWAGARMGEAPAPATGGAARVDR